MKNCPLCDSKFGFLNKQYFLDDGNVICTKCVNFLGLWYKPDEKKHKATPFEVLKVRYEERIDEKNEVEIVEEQKPVIKKIICPTCNNSDLTFIGNDRKQFSVGKAVVGTALTGGVGSLAGFAGKKGKNQWHCKECGAVFETK